MHLERNNSIITDFFSGLFKSELFVINITFDPFNTLTLAIPNNKNFFNFSDGGVSYIPKFLIYIIYLLDQVKKVIKNNKFNDIILFYIPKYCIKKNIRLRIRVKKEFPLKEVKEEIKKLDNFDYNIKNLKFIKFQINNL